jgi:hypothetical protein
MIEVKQLLASARGDLHEYAQNVFHDTDLIVWLNDGLQAVVAESHGMMEDWLTRRMRSTDAVETIQDESYDPASLTITGSTDLYTLPPNVLQIRSIEPLTDSDRQSGLTFLPRTATHPEFLRAARLLSQDEETIYFYALLGPRTLRLAPLPVSTVDLDIEMWYVALPERFVHGGTVTTVPIQAMKAIKAYAVWAAMSSINSPDATSKYSIYQAMIRELNSLSSTRQTNDPTFVEGAFDEEDYSGTHSY